MLPHSGATSAWRDWYRACHEDRFAQTQGTVFEGYVTDALKVIHGPTFQNPVPKGRLGDHGCDGITGDGRVAYAAFGYLPNRASERDLASKVQSDFERAKANWDTFETWRFVSNVGFGPLAAKELIAINRAHRLGAERFIEASQFDSTRFWDELLLPLPAKSLDQIFPGVPHASNINLADLYPLLDKLSSQRFGATEDVPDGAVSPAKMDFNGLSKRVRLEFQDARIHMPEISSWFAGNSDPTLRDSQGRRFRNIYLEARKSATSTNEIVERIYVSLGGADFRYDDELANAVYAVTAFFFDECDIFEAPPADWESPI